jgi:hypothetical protein
MLRLPASFDAFRWVNEYAPSVSGRFHGFREMVSRAERIDFMVKLAGRACHPARPAPGEKQ